MALTVTSANGAVTQNATMVKLTAFTNPSSGGIGPKTVMVLDGEAMLVTDASLSPTVQVVRGYTDPVSGKGTLGVAHNTLAPVVYGLTSDFSQLALQGSDSIKTAPVATYSVDGAITIPLVDQTIYITKAGVCALTLNGTIAADQTNTLRIVSLTANAHTITCTAGFYGNTTTSDVATFAATVGAAITLSFKNGLVYPVSTADDGVLIG